MELSQVQLELIQTGSRASIDCSYRPGRRAEHLTSSWNLLAGEVASANRLCQGFELSLPSKQFVLTPFQIF
ncbi:hypothetical protein L107_09991 [Cyanobium sp. Copco_Reservoir_LC18]|nr:hypothetical protein L107_09991 [Cyanobium sp. Copco_Reservoir_LC18]